MYLLILLCTKNNMSSYDDWQTAPISFKNLFNTLYFFEPTVHTSMQRMCTQLILYTYIRDFSRTSAAINPSPLDRVLCG